LDAGEGGFTDGGAGDHHDFGGTREHTLLKAECFADEATGAVADMGWPESLGGDDAQLPPAVGWSGEPIDDYTTLCVPPTGIADFDKIPPMLKAAGLWECQAHGRRARKGGSNRGEPFAAYATAIVQDAATTLGGRPCTETVLPHTADLGGLILALHRKLESSAGCGAADSINRAGTVKHPDGTDEDFGDREGEN